MTRRVVVIVDGEHYPPVTAQAVQIIGTRDQVVAAVFAGGMEKLSVPLDLGQVPIIGGEDPRIALHQAITQHRADAVVEISDDPIVSHAQRMELVAVAIALGAVYEAPGFRIEPPPRSLRAQVPSIAVIGSGKRCGKTAVGAHLARTLKAEGMTPLIIAMGRGGPEHPVLVRGDLAPPDARSLLAVADAGGHAAGDVYEDAMFAGVPVVGARRAGAGPGGTTGFDTVQAALDVAREVPHDILIVEGSGTAVPPVDVDVTVLVRRESDDPAAWPLPHRILLADLCIVTMLGEQVTQTPPLKSTFPSRDQAAVIFVRFHPTPSSSVEGRKLFVATTAPVATGDAIRAYLQQAHGAQVVAISHHLADRPRLVQDMTAAAGRYDVLACELKAAAVDVAVRRAFQEGTEVVFVDNRPAAVEGDLDARLVALARQAQRRFAAR